MKGMNTSTLIGAVIGGAVLLTAGVALWPVIATQLTAFGELNLTGGALLSSTIIGLLFVVAIGYAIYRSLGLKV